MVFLLNSYNIMGFLVIVVKLDMESYSDRIIDIVLLICLFGWLLLFMIRCCRVIVEVKK